MMQLAMFYEYEGTMYRYLLNDGGLHWLKQYDNLKAPVGISDNCFSSFSNAPTPNDYVLECPAPYMIQEKEERLRKIKALISDDYCIVDKGYRKQALASQAAIYGVSERTLRQWYYSYLAGGESKLYPKPRGKYNKPLTETEKTMRKYINKHYYSPIKLSLMNVYDIMIQEEYTTREGIVMRDCPTRKQFEHFYYRKHGDSIRKKISREGLSNYQRNYRVLYGKNDSRIENIGVYEMDATEADIHLVSRIDRKPIGRPYIYLATDKATRLITGVYVGLKAGGEAIAECLRQAASDKVEYCRQYGIEIQPEDWPCKGLPSQIVTDKGRDFLGQRVSDICSHYGIVVKDLEPYRPDLKGLVERTFKDLQNQFKVKLKGKGVIEPDFQERGAPDYRRQAKLDLDEFTYAVIKSILYMNKSRILSMERTPEMATDGVEPRASSLWNWYEEKGKKEMVLVAEENMHILLPRAKAKFTKEGLVFRNVAYLNKDYNNRCVLAGYGFNGPEEVEIAYNPLRTNKIYLVEDGQYIEFALTLANEQYYDYTYDEVNAFQANERRVKRQLEHSELQGRVDCMIGISSIAQLAIEKTQSLHSMRDIAKSSRYRAKESEVF